MALSRHRDLIAYRLAVDLADQLAAVARAWPSFERWTIGIQRVRAADSIGANIAEGFARGSVADRRRFLLIARASLSELEHWVDRAHARGLLDGSSFAPGLDEAGRTITGLIKAQRP